MLQNKDIVRQVGFYWGYTERHGQSNIKKKFFLEPKSDTLQTNRHFTPELSICALGDLEYFSCALAFQVLAKQTIISFVDCSQDIRFKDLRSNDLPPFH
jgi:hypothetical protein